VKYAALIPSKKMAYGSVEPPVAWLAGQESTAPAAQALKDLGGIGIDMPFPDIAKPEGGWAQISPENLGLIGEGADAILLWAPTRDVLDKFVAENPLWPRLPQVESDRALLAPNNVGNGSVYTIMETLRLWDQVYGKLA
jgi:ABC-type Fe3+-hydroxamate transport system substrate-binding protein